MLERDLITNNIQVLVKMLMKALGLYKDDPYKALEIINSYIDDHLLEQLLLDNPTVINTNDQLVKVNIDLFYLKSIIQYSSAPNEAIKMIVKAKQLLEKYNEKFPANFPFDYYQKINNLQNIISNHR